MVRFVQGRLNKKVYSRDPVKTARHWVRQGARWLHLVDLDGAFTGEPKNIAIIQQIAHDVDIPVQCGGGVRSVTTIAALLDAGVKRVVLGTKAIEDDRFLRAAFKRFKHKIIVSIDAKADEVLVKGWKSSTKRRLAHELALHLKDIGFKEFIYTDITKDGTLKGPSIKSTKALLKQTKMKIIASGGVSQLDDLMQLKLLERDGLSGVIIGKALYEARFTLAEALKVA